MSNQYLGEVRMFAGNFAPSGWALCNGQTLNISQYTALFALLGTTFGGNGVSTFQLPNLQGRLPLGQGQGLGLSNYIVGQNSGTENVSLSTTNLPQHNHALNASQTTANQANIANTLLPGKMPGTGKFYTVNTGTPPPTFGTLNAQTVGQTGGNNPHPNLMPSLCVSFIIAMVGIFPSRN